MESLDILNRLLNRAQRSLNTAATSAARSDLPDRKAAIEYLAGAIEQVSKTQDLIAKVAPSLVYHFDPARPPTEYMRAIGDLVQQADARIGQRDFKTAKSLLHDALALDPPPFAYDAIESKLKDLPPAAE